MPEQNRTQNDDRDNDEFVHRSSADGIQSTSATTAAAPRQGTDDPGPVLAEQHGKPHGGSECDAECHPEARAGADGVGGVGSGKKRAVAYHQ